MNITLTVDLATASARDIARAAKFMLVFAGFQDPAESQVAHDAAANLADRPSGAAAAAAEVQPDPGLAFAQNQQAQRSVIDNSTFGSPVAHVAPVTPPPGIEVDSQGVPWDQRIHAGSRAKIADGSWRQKRNLDPALYTSVMEELRHTMGVERRAPQPPAPPVPPQAFAPAPPIPPIPATPPQSEEAAYIESLQPDARREEVVPPAAPFAASVAPPAPPISPIPTVPASAGAATAASPGNAAAPAPTFPQLMQKITAAFHAKQLTQADIQRAVQSVNLTALPMLASRPDLVGAVATALGLAL